MDVVRAAALPNGRDLGGRTTSSGRRVAPGLVFRAGAPTAPEHAAVLAGLGVGTVHDLRTDMERAQIPLAVPATSEVHLADMLAEEPDDAPASLGRIARAALSGEAKHFTRDEVRQMYLHGYRSFVTLPGARRETGRVLAALAEPDGGPALIHCTAGKDRTGWVAALILLSLGVDHDEVMADYLASGPAVARMFAGLREMVIGEGGDVATFDFVLGVFPEYLDAAMRTMTTQFGSLEGFLTDGLGLPPDFRERLAMRLLTAL
jgi:protein-tyrosine phosphatase